MSAPNSRPGRCCFHAAGADFAVSISQVSGQLLAWRLLGKEWSPSSAAKICWWSSAPTSLRAQRIRFILRKRRKNTRSSRKSEVGGSQAAGNVARNLASAARPPPLVREFDTAIEAFCNSSTFCAHVRYQSQMIALPSRGVNFARPKVILNCLFKEH